MKKTTSKLELRRETLRALRVLEQRDLLRAHGGDGASQAHDQFESGRMCTAVAIAAPTVGG